MDTEALREQLQSIARIPEEEWQWLSSKLAHRSFDDGEQLFQVGVSCSSIHFVCRGLVRYFYSSEEGKERNHTFATEGDLVGCFPSLADGRPCPFTVEALEPTVTLLIDGSCVREFAARHQSWSELMLRLMAHVAIRKAAREEELLMETAEQRYRAFLSSYGDLAKRIPQYHIASYIGVTPVGLSRIRKRVISG